MSWLERLAQSRRRRKAEQRDELGRTHLMLAARAIKSEQVEQLLADGVDPNRVDPQGNTALHHAFLGQPNEPRGWMCAMHLVRAGADFNARNNDGETPALLALRHMVKGGYSGYRDQVRFMIEHGLDLHQTGRDGESPGSLLASNPGLFGEWSHYAQAALSQKTMEAQTAPVPATAPKPRVRL